MTAADLDFTPTAVTPAEVIALKAYSGLESTFGETYRLGKVCLRGKIS
jgi:hypothetical protein